MALPDNLADLARSFLGDAANQTISNPGFITLPNGLIIQWGGGTFAAGSATTVNLPKTFPTNTLAVFGSGANSSRCGIEAWSASNSQINVLPTLSTGGPYSGVWLAIGY